MKNKETEGNQDKTEENGDRISRSYDKKKIKVQENGEIGNMEQNVDEEDEGGGLSRAVGAATMVHKNEKAKDFTRWGVLGRQFWYFCDNTSLHGWSYVARFPGVQTKGYVHRAVWLLVRLLNLFLLIHFSYLKSLSLCLLAWLLVTLLHLALLRSTWR